MLRLHLLVAAVLWCLLTAGWTRAQTVWYVDDDAPLGGDGASWPTAYAYLQDALAMASAGDEIHVAKGTYLPDHNQAHPDGTGHQQATFRLITGAGLFGGYRGCPGGACTGGDPDVRDIDHYVTILDGDLAENDTGDWNDPSRFENTYHLVTGSGTDETAVLDGFTVTRGYASAPASSDYARGGGMYNLNGSPTVRGCAFLGNGARDGGGMYNRESSPRLTNCTFSRNRGFDGGGLNNYDHSNPMLENCRFLGNSAYSGGGMFNRHFSRPMLTNCLFSGNSADSNGGGMKNYDNAVITLTNCTFSGNSAGNYGGVNNGYASGLILANCILWSDLPNETSNGAVMDVTYSNVQGGAGESWFGEGCIDADPMFVDSDGADGIAGTTDDDLRFSPGSLCVNTGDPKFAPDPGKTDLDDHARVLCGRVDMGAYEFGIGDYDCDQSADLTDFGAWEACMTGPQSGPYDVGCEAFDFDYNGDVDTRDFAGFQMVFNGP